MVEPSAHLGDDDSRPDPAALQGHRLHDLRDSVPARLPREPIGDQSHDQTADGRSCDLPPKRQTVEVFEGVLPFAPGHAVQELNQEAETHGAQTTEQADYHGHQHHIDLLGLPQGVV
jgi:hypothetical protein